MMHTKTLVGLLNKIPKSELSHNRAYASTVCELLDCDMYSDIEAYSEKGTVLIYNGVSYVDGGGINIIGGLGETAYYRLVALADSTCELRSVDFTMPDLGEMVRKRLHNKSTFSGFDEALADKLTEKCKEVEPVYIRDLDLPHLTIGDSHSTSMRPEGSGLVRLDGKTLHGVLESGEIMYYIRGTTKSVTLVFGSVDIRHHLMRFDDPLDEMDKLMQRYSDFIDSLIRIGIAVEVVSPVPVEFEGRRIPGSGQYKGTNFYGTQKERWDLTMYFIDIMRGFNCTSISYPQEWYEMDSEQYATDIMERPQSVHIGFPNYRINNFGDYI